MGKKDARDRALIGIFLAGGQGCGGCSLEALAAMAPRYKAGQYGLAFVESPARADVIVLCGPLTGPAAEELQRQVSLLQPPWAMLRLGDCAAEEGEDGAMVVPGCPPSPEKILAAVREAWIARLGQAEEKRP